MKIYKLVGISTIALVFGFAVAPETTLAGISDAKEAIYEFLHDSRKASCKSHIANCLIKKEKHLKQSYSNLSNAQNELTIATNKSAQIILEQRSLIKKNAFFLNQGRSLYHSTDDNRELLFGSKIYANKAMLIEQLRILQSERKELVKIEITSVSFHDTLAQALEKIMVRKAALRAQISIIPAKIALAKAMQSYGCE